MNTDYLDQFPIPRTHIPERLRGLLAPVSNDPKFQVEVATRYDFDQYGPQREYVHMLMALTQGPEPDCSSLKNDAAHGLVSSGKPFVERQGALATFDPSVSGLDYIVASSGNPSFFSYNLSEKVWMALGLSLRCYGRDDAYSM